MGRPVNNCVVRRPRQDFAICVKICKKISKMNRILSYKSAERRRQKSNMFRPSISCHLLQIILTKHARASAVKQFHTPSCSAAPKLSRRKTPSPQDSAAPKLRRRKTLSPQTSVPGKFRRRKTPPPRDSVAAKLRHRRTPSPQNSAAAKLRRRKLPSPQTSVAANLAESYCISGSMASDVHEGSRNEKVISSEMILKRTFCSSTCRGNSEPQVSVKRQEMKHSCSQYSSCVYAPGG
jgi:hypothetical protein